MIDPTQSAPPPAPPAANGTALAPPNVGAPAPSPPTVPVAQPPALPTNPLNPPAAPRPPLPTVPPDSQPFARPNPQDISNPFERQAAMIVQGAYDQASKLAANLGDQASNTAEADSSTVHDMMQFSPYGVDAPRQFWILHDQILQQAVTAGDEDPYAVAERGALDAVYPYRSKIALLDQLAPAQAVARAAQLRQTVERQTAAGNTPDSLPHVTGPAGLEGAP